MLAIFLRFASHLRDHLASHGFWSNAIDPRTGTALFDAQGAPWSEVTAARSLLRYPTRDAAACPVVVHPEYGEACLRGKAVEDAAVPQSKAQMSVMFYEITPHGVCRHQMLPRNRVHRCAFWRLDEGACGCQQPDSRRCRSSDLLGGPQGCIGIHVCILKLQHASRRLYHQQLFCQPPLWQRYPV